ncbi:hypothetical protein ACGGZK_14750 [Agromyces sp. MMS24-K17]|uniref:hypothetical protein n=1 Tax=Agromyces sp. MMS24-K17 TaxID=3372850 RepID=UPI0037551C39
MKTLRAWDVHPDQPLPALDEDSWIAVSESDTGRFWVRVAEAADGRLIITGMLMRDEREITANTLRAIQPAAILKTIAWRESGGTPPPSVGAIDPTTELARFEGVADEIASIATTAPSTAAESKRGRRARVAAILNSSRRSISASTALAEPIRSSRRGKRSTSAARRRIVASTNVEPSGSSHRKRTTDDL